jgi:CelD/BcsL family acetyltransferase involved in cellulose biosynthesis
MRIELHTDLATLAPLAANWNKLARGVPFRQWEWNEAWWRHYGLNSEGKSLANCELHVLTVHSNDELVGIAPWYRTRSRTGAQVIRFLGDGEVCSDYVTILCRDGLEADVATAIAEWLSHAVSGGNSITETSWDRLELTGIDAADDPVNGLLTALTERGSLVHHGKSLCTWRVDLTPAWDDFLMVLSKQHRNRLRRADRTYIQSGLVQSHPVNSPTDFERAFEVLVDLHQRRWNSRGLPGCFSLPRFKAFHREISELFVNTGRAMLTWMEYEGKPLSAEYRLLGGRVMYAYQSGVDPDRLDIQPGELANMGAIRAAIEQNYASYDFLRGDEEYKSRWRGNPRTTLAVRVVPPRATARLRHNAWLTGQSVKNVIKGGLRLTGLRSADT